MEAIIVMLNPFIVSGLTWLVKKLGITSPLSDGWETAALRFLVALFSFLSTLAAAKLSGVPVDATSISTFALTVMTFLSSTGVYFFTAKK